MSTEIKNTLFRFVTMRAPELVEKEKIEKTFVQHPFAGASGFKMYHDKHPSNPKRLNLKNYAIEFSNSSFAFKNIDELKIYVNDFFSSQFFEFATWLTANRKKVTPKTLEQSLQKFSLNRPGFTEFDFDRSIILWDNLIYQIITSKSSYIRESILSVLVANLFLKERLQLGNDLKALRRLAQARVALPKELFSTENTSASISAKNSVSTLKYQETPLSQTMEITLIEHQATQLKTMQESISILEKRYKKENDKSLGLYQKDYNIEVEAAYEKAREEKIVIDPITKEEKTIVEYNNLKLPKFDFQPADEMLFLEKNSKNADYGWIVDYCKNVLGHDTFSEIQEFATKKGNELTEMLFQRTTVTQKYKNKGGVLFPLVPMTDRGNFFNFQSLQTGSMKKLVVEFLEMESGATIRQGNYNLKFIGGFDQNGTSVSSRWVNNKFQVTLFGTESIVDQSGDFTVQGTLVLQNGKEITFSGNGTGILTGGFDPMNPISPSSPNNSPGSDMGLTTFRLSGDGYYNLIEVKPPVTNPENPNPEVPDQGEEPDTNLGNGVIEYIPSGFGIKRLGIADYRKVEQEVCCYVPGEVSHIENVMASEYKERATRRLRRTEDTTTTSKEKESEKLTDTTSTDRFEMNSEVASVLAEDSHVGGYASMNANYAKITLSAGADFANNTSTEDSNSQAVTHAKEVTERALDRVVQKVKEERISKVIEEFEENNKHGFDNRKNTEHVSGVYRWVDKIYKNKIINYGKRLMYEFMIPEPASFHKQAIAEFNTNDEDIIERPLDPRNVTGNMNLKDHKQINENTYSYWAGIYNATIESCPSKNISIGKEFNFDSLNNDNTSKSWSDKHNLSIPDGYKTIGATVSLAGPKMSNSWQSSAAVSVGNLRYMNLNGNDNMQISPKTGDTLNSFEKSIPISVYFIAFHTGTVNVNVQLERTDSYYQQWQIDTFNTIIKAYEAKLEEYNAKVKEMKALQTEKMRTNPLFYREIENMVLKKNCLDYLASNETLGQENFITGTELKNLRVKYDDPKLDAYAAKVKFFEQAFEWDLMSYNFYPFYWAQKNNWKSSYNIDETDDATFKAFLQSGMARVILTIRPGFEEAVNWYMATGQVWNGGQVPTMDDELFLSIVEELREPEGEVEETWETRVPTSLTIIQAGSIGMEVPTALPCDEDCKDYKLFDSDGKPVLDKDNKQVSTNPFKKRTTTLKGESSNVKPIENIDIKNGNLQLSTDENPRKVVAQISVEAIKKEMGL